MTTIYLVMAEYASGDGCTYSNEFTWPVKTYLNRDDADFNAMVATDRAKEIFDAIRETRVQMVEVKQKISEKYPLRGNDTVVRRNMELGIAEREVVDKNFESWLDQNICPIINLYDPQLAERTGVLTPYGGPTENDSDVTYTVVEIELV